MPKLTRKDCIAHCHRSTMCRYGIVSTGHAHTRELCRLPGVHQQTMPRIPNAERTPATSLERGSGSSLYFSGHIVTNIARLTGDDQPTLSPPDDTHTRTEFERARLNTARHDAHLLVPQVALRGHSNKFRRAAGQWGTFPGRTSLIILGYH